MKRLWLLCTLGIFVLMLISGCGSSSTENQEESFKKWFAVVEPELNSIDENLKEIEQLIKERPKDRKDIEKRIKRIKDLRKEIDEHQEKIRDQKVPKLTNKEDYEKLKENANTLGSIDYHSAIDLILDFTEKIKKGEDGKESLKKGFKQLQNLNQWSNELYIEVLGIAAKINKDLITKDLLHKSSTDKKLESNIDTKSHTDEKENAESGEQIHKKAAQEYFNKIGLSKTVVATSLGHSNKGFISRLDDGSVVLVDKVNNQTVKISPASAITQIANYQGSSKQSIKLELLILNDGRGSDAANGAWMGNDHLIPVTVEYNYENGQHIPYMIKSGSGASPASYDNYLYEQKNVDAVNMIIEEAAAMK